MVVNLKTVFLNFLLSAPLLAWTQGKVGINTADPLAGLHVQDSAVLFRGTFNSMTPGNPPVSGAGTRMMWYPDKAAFRAGEVFSTNWNRDSIGNYSVVIGYNGRAKGSGAVSMGLGNRATGSGSVAFGSNTQASGTFATAFGGGSVASGNHSLAMGGGSHAYGDYSVALGNDVEAAYSSVAAGYSNEAAGSYSTAFGFANIASGSYSTATGALNEARGTASTSLGFRSMANGYASLAIGVNNDTIVSPQLMITPNTPLFIIGNGDHDTSRSNALTVLKNGRVGIGDTSPNALTHIKNGSGGGLYSGSALMILEAANNFYLQLSAPTGLESGILFGNGISSIRSGIVFDASGELDLRANGNTTRLRVETNGDINVFSGEMQRTATGNTDLLPLCYGSVSSTGAINNGSTNFTVTTTSTGVYEIAITDVTYNSLTHVAVATANNSSVRIVNTSTAGSNLVIRIFNIAGALVDNAFQFVVFEP